MKASVIFTEGFKVLLNIYGQILGQYPKILHDNFFPQLSQFFTIVLLFNKYAEEISERKKARKEGKEKGQKESSESNILI
jgi:hypothetical protein